MAFDCAGAGIPFHVARQHELERKISAEQNEKSFARRRAQRKRAFFVRPEGEEMKVLILSQQANK